MCGAGRDTGGDPATGLLAVGAGGLLRDTRRGCERLGRELRIVLVATHAMHCSAAPSFTVSQYWQIQVTQTPGSNPEFREWFKRNNTVFN